MTKTYSYNRWKLHILIPWLLVMAPVGIAWRVTQSIADQLDALGEFLKKVLPEPYVVVEWVEFDQLPRRIQKELKQEEEKRKEVRERMLSQVDRCPWDEYCEASLDLSDQDDVDND